MHLNTLFFSACAKSNDFIHLVNRTVSLAGEEFTPISGGLIHGLLEVIRNLKPRSRTFFLLMNSTEVLKPPQVKREKIAFKD